MSIRTKKSTVTIINVFLSILGIIWMCPIFFVVMNVFKTKQEYNMGSFWSLPKNNAVWDNLKNVVANKVLVSMGSSLLYAVVGAAMAVFIALLAAYGLTHLRIKHKLFWFLLIYSGTIFPFQVYLIPVYRGYYHLGLYNTRIGMILFYCAICIPFSMFVLRNFFLGISSEICESARMDGASSWQVLMKILAPMAKAPLSIVFMSQFTWSWNDLMFGLTFTKSSDIRPVMASVSLLSTGNPPSLFLACIIVSIPTIILFFLLQDNFEVGMAYTGK